MVGKVTTTKSPLANVNATSGIRIVALGPIEIINFPVRSGKSVEPKLAPTTNHPVTRPVKFILLLAKESVAGNIDAIEKPRAIVAIESNINDCAGCNIVSRLNTAPVKLPKIITSGFVRVVRGIKTIRPAVSAPQNNEVRYAADVAVPSLVVKAYV